MMSFERMMFELVLEKHRQFVEEQQCLQYIEYEFELEHSLMMMFDIDIEHLKKQLQLQEVVLDSEQFV